MKIFNRVLAVGMLVLSAGLVIHDSDSPRAQACTMTIVGYEHPSGDEVTTQECNLIRCKTVTKTFPVSIRCGNVSSTCNQLAQRPAPVGPDVDYHGVNRSVRGDDDSADCIIHTDYDNNSSRRVCLSHIE